MEKKADKKQIYELKTKLQNTRPGITPQILLFDKKGSPNIFSLFGSFEQFWCSLFRMFTRFECSDCSVFGLIGLFGMHAARRIQSGYSK